MKIRYAKIVFFWQHIHWLLKNLFIDLYLKNLSVQLNSHILCALLWFNANLRNGKRSDGKV